MEYHRSIIREHAIADFNGDGQLDLAFISTIEKSMNVLLGNGSGLFHIERTSLQYEFYFPGKISVGDFNNDNKLDLVVMSDERVKV